MFARTIAVASAALCLALAAATAAPPAAPSTAPASDAKPVQAAQPLAPEILAAAETYADFMQQMAKVMAATTADCEAMGAQLSALVDARGERVGAATRTIALLPKADRRRLPPSFEVRLKAALPALLDAGVKCGKNPKVQAAMQRLNP